MQQDPDPDRLAALEARLARAKDRPAAPRSKMAQGFSQGEMAWRMVIELATGIALGVFIGYGLDWAFGTLPVFLMVFSLVGLAAGVKTMLGTARQVQEAALRADDRIRAAEAARDEGE
jgi:ATP synthase protein I